MPTLDASAPTYLHIYNRQLERELAEVRGRSPRPFKLPVYTVATLPDATEFPYCLVAVSDGASNQRLALSDGTVWRYPSGTAV